MNLLIRVWAAVWADVPFGKEYCAGKINPSLFEKPLGSLTEEKAVLTSDFANP